MIDFGSICIAYVSWRSGGKNRPVLIREINNDCAVCYSITTRYNIYSPTVQTNYFMINDLECTGLRRQSYIDTTRYYYIPIGSISEENIIGYLSDTDKIKLLEFILAKQNKE
jgi:hypothetical protein